MGTLRAHRGRPGRVPRAAAVVGHGPPFGFSPDGAGGAPWLPQPADFAAITAEAQDIDPNSMLTLYRAALALRREHTALGDGELTWLPAGPEVLAFSRGGGFACVANLSAAPVPLPEGSQVLLASGPLDGAGLLPADTAAWLENH